MFGYFGERSPYFDSNMDRRLTRKVKKMMEDMEFSHRLSEFIKENEKKDKDKKDDKKKEGPIKDILATLFLLTAFGPWVGLLQLYLLTWTAGIWQRALH